MQTEVVVLNAGPCWILSWWAFVAIADSVFPVVTADEIAAWPAVDGRVELLELSECVGPHAVHVVRGHQRCRPNQEFASAFAGDGESGTVRGRAGRKPYWNFLELLGDSLDGDGFGIGFAVAPMETHLNGRRRRIPRNNHVAFIRLTGNQSQSRLRDAAGHSTIAEIHLRRVFANEGIFRDHRDAARIPDGLPRRRNVNPVPARFANGGIEFAILEHFSPNASVNTAAQVLDELPVN